METRAKISTPTGEADCHIIPIEACHEQTTVVELEDGSRLRIRCVVENVARLIDKYDDDGNPIYVASISNKLTNVYIPPKLRRPAIMQQ